MRPIVNPDEEIRRGYSQLTHSTATSRRTSGPEPSLSAPFPSTNRPNNLYEYGELGVGSGVVGSLASVQLPTSSLSASPPTNDATEEDDSYTVGILELPSPPTFPPVEEDDIEAEEEIIHRLLDGSSSSSMEQGRSEAGGVFLKTSSDDRVVWRQKKAFSASIVQSKQHQSGETALLMDQGDLSKYLMFIAGKEQTRQDEEIQAMFRKRDNLEDREVREKSSPIVVREEAILVMGMAVQGTETDQSTIADTEEFEWIDDTENGKTFKVSKNLSVDARAQGRFFTKIMWIKAIQAAVICLWLAIVGSVESLKSAVIKSHDWAFFVASGLFVALFIVTRLMGRRKSKWHWSPITLVLLLMTCIMAYAVASVRYKYDILIVSVSVWILLGSFLLMGIIPFMCDCIASVPNWGHTGVVVTLLSGVAVLLISMFASRSIDVRHFTLYTWFPSLFVAELVLWVLVWELRCIVQGYAFKASETRWYFASLWV